MKVGIDIVDLEKFKNSLSSGGKAMRGKIFTKRELSTAKTINKLSGIFASKEAFIKASSVRKLKMNEVEIRSDKSGKPILVKPEEYALNKNVEISIAHDGNYVVAICFIDVN